MIFNFNVLGSFECKNEFLERKIRILLSQNWNVSLMNSITNNVDF